MKKYLFLLLPLTFMACQSASNQAEKETNEAISEPVEERIPTVNFQCVQMEGAKTEMLEAETVVSVLVDEKSYILDTIFTCEKIDHSEFNNYEIPETALAATGGWWAGAGDYFYAIEKEGNILVFQGWLDEMQEDEGYHYKQVKVIRSL